MSGGITLDGVTGDVDAHTVSGALEAQGVNGKLSFNTVSGDLTLADGWLERMDVNAVSGDVTADVDLDPLGGMHVTTVSGEVTLRLPAESRRPGPPALHVRRGAQRIRRAEVDVRACVSYGKR